MTASHLPTALVLTAALALPAAAAAAPTSSFAESRGYQNCRTAAERAVDLVGLDSRYYIYDHNDARRYYMNGYARIDGVSTTVKIDCQTTVSGRRIETVSVAIGHFAGRVVGRPAVANN